jgi:hypothetical protein
MTAKITLEWTQLETGERALLFNAHTWAAFEKTAQAQGKSAHQLIATAVAASLGTVMTNNYKIIAGSKTTTPNFSGSGEMSKPLKPRRRNRKADRALDRIVTQLFARR